MSDAMIGWVSGGLAVIVTVWLVVRLVIEDVRMRRTRDSAFDEYVQRVGYLVHDLGDKLGYAADNCKFIPAHEKYLGAPPTVLGEIKELRSEITSLRQALRITNDNIKLVKEHGDQSLLLRAKEIEARLDDKASISATLKFIEAHADRIHGLEDALNLTWVEIPEQEGYVQNEDPRQPASAVSEKQKTKQARRPRR